MRIISHKIKRLKNYTQKNLQNMDSDFMWIISEEMIHMNSEALF